MKIFVCSLIAILSVSVSKADSLNVHVGDLLRTPALAKGKVIGLYYYTNRVNCAICDQSIDLLAASFADSGISVDYRKFIAGVDDSMVEYYATSAPQAKIIPDEILAYRHAVSTFAEPFWVIITPDKRVVTLGEGRLPYDKDAVYARVHAVIAGNTPQRAAEPVVELDLGAYAPAALNRRQYLSCDGRILTVVLYKPAVVVTYDMDRHTTTFTKVDSSIHDVLFGLLGSTQLGCSDTIMLICNGLTNYRKIALLNVRTLRIDTLAFRDRFTVLDTTSFSTKMAYIPASNTIVGTLVRLDSNRTLRTDDPTLISFTLDSTREQYSSLGPTEGYLHHQWSILPSSAMHVPSHSSDTIVEWMSYTNTVRILATAPRLLVVRNISLPPLGAGYKRYAEDFPYKGSSADIQRAYGQRSMGEDVYLRNDTLGITWMNVNYGAPNDAQMPFTIDYGVSFSVVEASGTRTILEKMYTNGENPTLLVNRPGYLVSELDRSLLKIYLHDSVPRP